MKIREATIGSTFKVRIGNRVWSDGIYKLCSASTNTCRIRNVKDSYVFGISSDSNIRLEGVEAFADYLIKERGACGLLAN